MLLAAGRVDEAESAYRTALRLTLEEQRRTGFEDTYLIAGALTDLELIIRHRAELADEAGPSRR